MTEEILSDNEDLVGELVKFRLGLNRIPEQPNWVLGSHVKDARYFLVKHGFVKLLPPPTPKSEGERIFLKVCNERAGINCSPERFAEIINAAIRERTEAIERIVECAEVYGRQGVDEGRTRILISKSEIIAAIRKLNEATP